MATKAIHFCVDRDKLTGGIQLSIDDEGGGYRIAGPKYSGMSTSLIRHAVTERDVKEIRAYLTKARATAEHDR